LLYRFDKRQADNAHASDRGDDNRNALMVGHLSPSLTIWRLLLPLMLRTVTLKGVFLCEQKAVRASVFGARHQVAFFFWHGRLLLSCLTCTRSPTHQGSSRLASHVKSGKGKGMLCLFIQALKLKQYSKILFACLL
jgi:hypothetical protein